MLPGPEVTQGLRHRRQSRLQAQKVKEDQEPDVLEAGPNSFLQAPAGST